MPFTASNIYLLLNRDCRVYHGVLPELLFGFSGYKFNPISVTQILLQKTGNYDPISILMSSS